MPYIPDLERRKELDEIVRLMAELKMDWDGEMNYVSFAFFVRNVPRKYNEIKKYKGELNECSDEIQRRFLGPLEDTKIKENGDVF